MPRRPEAASRFTVVGAVIGYAWHDDQILGCVVTPIMIAVVDLLVRPQAAAEHLLGNNSMLVGVAADVREVMSNANPDQNIAMLGHRPAAAPIAVPIPRCTPHQNGTSLFLLAANACLS